MKFLGSIFLAAMAAFSIFGQQANRTVAVTIDDLPVVSTRSDLKNRQQITKKLIGHITKAKVPAIGFVNENKLFSGEERDDKQVDLLRMWLAAGLELGNHTYSHRSLNQIPLADYEADLLKGEAITSGLMAEKGRKCAFSAIRFYRPGERWRSRQRSILFWMSTAIGSRRSLLITQITFFPEPMTLLLTAKIKS